jgi:bifunctional DNA-binding transcriptional regulator/antitoxin component of YhaV-PrlF toxin-antitoxin module
MQVTTKGQVTIPNQYRIKYGLLPHVRVEFCEKNGFLCIVKGKIKAKMESRSSHIVRQMRSVKINKTMTTEEIMEMTRGYRIDDKEPIKGK